MNNALKLGLLAAGLMLAGSTAMAGGAPAAYYPSLGYGQTPPAYVDEPAHYEADDRPPPQAHLDHPSYRYEAHEHGDADDRTEAYSSRSEEDHGYDSGWRPHSGHSDDTHGREAEHARGYGGEHAYAAESREDYAYDSGWRFRRIEPEPMMCPYAHEHREAAPHPICPSMHEGEYGYAEHEHLPDSFFADAGGVGPDEFAWGGGGGGGMVVGGSSSASSFAFASARASAHVGLGVRIGRHGGGHGGGHMSHGCGCRK